MTQQRSQPLLRFDRPACQQRRTTQYQQAGLTMVELLVAMLISLFIALAAVAALTVTRQGFNAVDASSQLRDNGRFAADLLQRLGVQSGYKDLQYAAVEIPPTAVAGLASNPDPNIFGFNNAKFSATDPTHASVTRTSTSEVGFGSDVLVMRYQAVETYPGSGVSDNSMIDCAGNPAPNIPADRYSREVSVLHVALSQGEPALMCTTIKLSDGTISTQPIIQGVENFQVLYGTDGVTAGAAPTIATDSVPDRYLRADQLSVSSNPVATNANWRRVRSLRIGMVLRGAANSAIDRSSTTYYPFGLAKNSSTGTAGLAMSQTVASANDPGTVFTPSLDGRLRQTLTFTVHLRNEQGL